MNKLFLFAIAFPFLGCSPRFTSNNPKDIVLGKAEVKTIYGSWQHNQEEKDFSLTIRLDIDPLNIRYNETCTSRKNQTSIQMLSRATVGAGSLTLLDGITGTIQNGQLHCGMDFPAKQYSVVVNGKVLTLQTTSGPMNFERVDKN